MQDIVMLKNEGKENMNGQIKNQQNEKKTPIGSTETNVSSTITTTTTTTTATNLIKKSETNEPFIINKKNNFNNKSIKIHEPSTKMELDICSC